jgi:hypothetical protein
VLGVATLIGGLVLLAFFLWNSGGGPNSGSGSTANSGGADQGNRDGGDGGVNPKIAKGTTRGGAFKMELKNLRLYLDGSEYDELMLLYGENGTQEMLREARKQVLETPLTSVPGSTSKTMKSFYKKMRAEADPQTVKVFTKLLKQTVAITVKRYRYERGCLRFPQAAVTPSAPSGAIREVLHNFGSKPFPKVLQPLITAVPETPDAKVDPVTRSIFSRYWQSKLFDWLIGEYSLKRLNPAGDGS